MSIALETGLYVGRRMLPHPLGDKDLGVVVVQVSGTEPWLKMCLLQPNPEPINPNTVVNLRRIDQLD